MRMKSIRIMMDDENNINICEQWNELKYRNDKDNHKRKSNWEVLFLFAFSILLPFILLQSKGGNDVTQKIFGIRKKTEKTMPEPLCVIKAHGKMF